jgi:hypothetical protein
LKAVSTAIQQTLFFELNLKSLKEDYIRGSPEAEIAKIVTLKWIKDKLHLNNQTMEDLSLPAPDLPVINQQIEAQVGEKNESTRQEKRLMG